MIGGACFNAALINLTGFLTALCPLETVPTAKLISFRQRCPSRQTEHTIIIS
jgi:hypothetical protein